MTVLDAAVTAACWWPYAAVALRLCRIVALFRPVPERLVAVLRAVVGEVRPFYLPAVGVRGVQLVADGGPVWMAVLVVLLAALNLWLFRDEDDDRWKRRRRRAAEAIKRVGSRLVVVPAGAQS